MDMYGNQPPMSGQGHQTRADCCSELQSISHECTAASGPSSTGCHEPPGCNCGSWTYGFPGSNSNPQHIQCQCSVDAIATEALRNCCRASGGTEFGGRGQTHSPSGYRQGGRMPRRTRKFHTGGNASAAHIKLHGIAEGMGKKYKHGPSVMSGYGGSTGANVMSDQGDCCACLRGRAGVVCDTTTCTCTEFIGGAVVTGGGTGKLRPRPAQAHPTFQCPSMQCYQQNADGTWGCGWCHTSAPEPNEYRQGGRTPRRRRR